MSSKTLNSLYEIVFKSYDLTKIALVLALILAVSYLFLLDLATIDGPSMTPTLTSGSTALVQKISYKFSPPRRGDLISFRFPGNPLSTRYVKRVIGLPGDQVKIESNQIFINNRPYLTIAVEPINDLSAKSVDKSFSGQWTVPAGQYFVLGDNIANSTDSRHFGSIDQQSIIGKLELIIWPINSFKIL